jgi:hypothetical protein
MIEWLFPNLNYVVIKIYLKRYKMQILYILGWTFGGTDVDTRPQNDGLICLCLQNVCDSAVASVKML